MNTSQAWVELALKTLSCNQKELARRLRVSPTQISKWKNGEHMSSDMEDKVRAMVKIGAGKYPEFVLWAGSLEDARKWERLIRFLADDALDGAETGYETYPLLDEYPGLLAVQVTDTLRDMGVAPPKAFPPKLDAHFQGEGDTENDTRDVPEEIWELLGTNPYSRIIRDIFDSLNNVWGFYAAYVENVADDDAGTLYDAKSEIEAALIDLAACKIAVDDKFAPKFRTFKQRVLNELEDLLTIIKEAAFRAGTPLRAELLEMVGEDAEELGHAAEAEALGFNAGRLHPDIYMNELLVGMRVIHQVLPAILKKLEIDLKVDESELHINVGGPRAFSKAAVDEEGSEDA
jgi:transcriptional regulator with XRE-family HTH domain